MSVSADSALTSTTIVIIYGFLCGRNIDCTSVELCSLLKVPLLEVVVALFLQCGGKLRSLLCQSLHQSHLGVLLFTEHAPRLACPRIVPSSDHQSLENDREEVRARYVKWTYCWRLWSKDRTRSFHSTCFFVFRVPQISLSGVVAF